MDETIISDSNVGKRLEKLKKAEIVALSCQGKSYSAVGKMTIGRGRDNTIQVDDNLASRHHALLQKINDAYFIKDLNSTNGTRVNGKQIPEGKYIKLKSKDVIKIGRTEITIQ